jgi:ligand-binding SRPBCC domain-containing protein
MAFYQLKRTQVLPASLDEVWTFIAAPRNLQRITPDYMGFDITSSDLPEQMYTGMIISYKVSPLLGIAMDWVTEITHLKEKAYFVDEQRIGPYNVWHHEHHIKPVDQGVEMHDIVTYQPPFGMLGALVHPLIIRKKLNEIFAYRWKALEDEFGKIPA